MLPTLEEILTHANLFGLETASPLQRAICRLLDGRPLGILASDPAVVGAIGYNAGEGSRSPPRECLLLAGIRSGKSLLASATAVRWSQICDVSKLGPGEVPRISIVSVSKDLADVVCNHLIGRVTESELLSSLVVETAADGVTLRHPSGRPIEIKVVAGTRAGTAVVARWSAGLIADEAPRMFGRQEGVVNIEDLRHAISRRLLPGAQVMYIGSPWSPASPVAEWYSRNWGDPNSDMLAIRAPAYHMNPIVWTPAEVAKARLGDPDVFRTDVEAQFGGQGATLYPADLVTAALGDYQEEAPIDGWSYVAAMDPATRANGWTLVVTTADAVHRRVVLAREWRGSYQEPLDPFAVLTEMSSLLQPYGVSTIMSDQYYSDALASIGQRVGISVVYDHARHQDRVQGYLNLRNLLESKSVVLPNNRVLINDLLMVSKRLTAQGVAIVLPKTQDGRHCDYAPALTLALSQHIRRPITSSNETEIERKRLLAATMRKYGRRNEAF